MREQIISKTVIETNLFINIVNVFGIVTPITPVTLWVSSRDGSIVQMVISDVDYNIGDIQANFFNTVLGPVSPSIYVSTLMFRCER